MFYSYYRKGNIPDNLQETMRYLIRKKNDWEPGLDTAGVIRSARKESLPYRYQGIHRMGPVICPFCTPVPEGIIIGNESAYSRFDKYQASPSHLLIIPKRHIPSISEATPGEIAALWDLVSMAKQILDEKYSPD